MLQRFNFVNLSKAPAAANGKTPRERGGKRGLFRLPLSGALLVGTPARCRFLLGISVKNIPLKLPGERKGEAFTLGFH
jgi:hypothetical protein